MKLKIGDRVHLQQIDVTDITGTVSEIITTDFQGTRPEPLYTVEYDNPNRAGCKGGYFHRDRLIKIRKEVLCQ